MQGRQVFTPDVKDEIVRKYYAGMSAEQLSDAYKCGISTVYAWAKESRIQNKLLAQPAGLAEENQKLKELLLFLLKEHPIK